MDTKISKEVIKQRRRKQLIKFSVVGVLAVVLFIFLRNVLSSAVDINSLTTSTVDSGSIKISVGASGKVTPLTEEIITSPIASKVLDVYKRSGENIHEGDLILHLDLSATNTDFESKRDELEMKQGKIDQQKSNSQTRLSEMAIQMQIDSMRLKRSEVQLRNEQYLDSIGASTSDKIRQAELELQVQKLEYEQLKLKYKNLKKDTDADIRVLELDHSIALKNFALTSKTVGDAQVRSPRSATLTWVNDQIGSTVAQGAQLAIVSDLSHFKIEAEIADSYASKVSPGNAAIVKIGSKELTGVVGNVVPAVKDGLIKFIITLDDNDNEVLRSGLKTDVYVISSVKDDVLRIDNRSFYSGAGDYELWIIENGTAYKRNIVLGESSYDKIEVIEGLNRDDVVILSEMNRYSNKAKIKVK